MEVLLVCSLLLVHAQAVVLAPFGCRYAGIRIAQEINTSRYQTALADSLHKTPKTRRTTRYYPRAPHPGEVPK